MNLGALSCGVFRHPMATTFFSPGFSPRDGPVPGLGTQCGNVPMSYVFEHAGFFLDIAAKLPCVS